MKKLLAVPALVLMLTAFQQSVNNPGDRHTYRRPVDSIKTIAPAADSLKTDVQDVKTALSQLNAEL